MPTKDKSEACEVGQKTQESRGDSGNSDDEYEEAIVYVNLPSFMGYDYLEHAKKVVLKNITGVGDTGPRMVVDGTEFKGAHTVNLGSNHFFAHSALSSSEPPDYIGHSLKTTEFTLSRIHTVTPKRMEKSTTSESDAPCGD